MEFTQVKEVEHEEKSVQEIEQTLLEQQEAQRQQQESANAEAERLAQEQAIKDEADKQSQQPTPPEIDDNVVLTHINKKTGKAFQSIDDLFVPELPEDVAEFNKYKKETGRSLKEYFELQRDYEKEDPKTLIAKHMAIKNPELNEDDIAFEMDKFTYDEALDDERDVKAKKIAMKKELSEALSYFNKQKEQYKIPLESRSIDIPDAEKEQYEAFKRTASDIEQGKKAADYFVQKTNELFTNDFKGFDFNVGDKNITFTPGETEKIKQTQLRVANFIESHLNENGLLKDAKAYHKSLAVAMNPDLFAKHFYEQGIADYISKLDIESKNINMGTVRNAPIVQVGKEGMQVRALDESHGSGLKIPSKKRA